MIKDNIENAQKYYGISERLKKGFEFLEKNNLENFENGKYEIDGENIFVSVQDYNTKPENEGKFEAHQKYADIQFIIKGKEKLGFVNINSCKPSTFYDEKNDIIFLEGKGDFITANKGDFLVFYPQDAHMPCISVDSSEYVKKAVVKVKLC